MGISAQGNTAARFFGQTHQLHVEILSVRIAVDLHSFVQLRGKLENARPFRQQAGGGNYKCALEGAPKYGRKGYATPRDTAPFDLLVRAATNESTPAQYPVVLTPAYPYRLHRAG